MSYLGFFQQLSLHRGLAVEEIPGNRVREGGREPGAFMQNA